MGIARTTMLFSSSLWLRWSIKDKSVPGMYIAILGMYSLYHPIIVRYTQKQTDFVNSMSLGTSVRL